MMGNNCGAQDVGVDSADLVYNFSGSHLQGQVENMKQLGTSNKWDGQYV